ncbi:hypothetical protein G4B88_004902 [Cannabis sativa]|uniref:Rx N-terminal domain-containing protein n=1 Tax=Cannabis sativa TaxID=3483 RepID=A0A7J6FXZ3_CANSA|nr:hypothetical protein G4B88_004902 [Cannabis sativa]
MAEVLVSLVLEQLASFTNRQIEQQWSLVRSGVEEKVENLSNNLEDIQMVLVDADKRQIVDASVKRWLDKLKVVSYEIETTMYEWNTAIALRSNLKLFDKVCFFTLPCLHRNHVHRHGLHRRVGLKIEKLNEKLDRISNEKERYTFRTAIEYESYRSNNTITTSFVDVSKVCGRDVEKKILIDKDEHENIIRCKMHDIVHDFVLFLTKNDCFNSHISSKNDELKLLSSKAFHYTLLLECNVPRSEYYKLNINLCPILHLEYLSCTFSPWSIVPPSIYNKRKLLTLSIIGNPGSIKWDLLFKLTCLRTLNLSGCLPPNSKIPKGIDKLILLRYLNLSNNGWLVLPKTLGNLFNLQTLNLEKSRGWLPKEIGKLVNLRHLYLGDFCCKFSKELGKLTGLKTLESYNFLYVVVEKRGKMLFQNWMMSLNNLKSLVLVRCNYCVSLGPFGNLPSLESLTLNFMINVKTLGNEFLGIENTTTTTESFPKLKTLRFIEFWSWEEWKYCSDRSQAIMPRLQFLHFDRCEKLEAPLPEFLRNTMLKTLTIRQCNKLKPLFKEGLRMEELVNILTRHPTNQNSLRGTVHRLADVII